MESYAQVAALPESDLRHLLEHGSPPTRIYAAWAMGVRLGGAISPEIASQAQRDPVSGVRRHLMVLLAGAGEKAVIAAFVSRDPDPEVRATACQYLARLLEVDDLAFYDLLLDRASNDPAEEVRLAVVTNIRDDLPATARERIEARLQDTSPEVQRAALRRLVAWCDDRIPQHLKDRLLAETDPDIRFEGIRRWMDKEGVEAILTELADAPEPPIVDALVLLRQRSVRVAWSRVKPFTKRNHLRVAVELARLLGDHPDDVPYTFWFGVASRWMTLQRDEPEVFNLALAALIRALDAVATCDVKDFRVLRGFAHRLRAQPVSPVAKVPLHPALYRLLDDPDLGDIGVFDRYAGEFLLRFFRPAPGDPSAGGSHVVR